uniref:SLATT domain-containing protein n=1 Tax=viral metagenome TaxID=1070528 RepID=A0A6C0AIN9_9ZZZZ
MENDWTEDIETVLENIRINCVLLSNTHKSRYFVLHESLKFYRLPVIVLSGLNSIFSVGLQPYVEQQAISIINCLLALTCSIIGSIELFLQVQKSMEGEMISQREYYLLGVDIFKTLALSKQHRPVPAKEYLEKCYSSYCALIESSNAVASKIEDKLCPIEPFIPNPIPRTELPRTLSLELQNTV